MYKAVRNMKTFNFVGIRTKREATEKQYCNTRHRLSSVFSDDLSVENPDSNDSEELPVREFDLDPGYMNDNARLEHPDSNE